MNIGSEIKQQNFKNVKQKAMLNLLFTYGWAVERIRLSLSSEDITLQQFNILRILRGASPTPLSTLQIRERMLDKMSDTSRIVDRMVAKGLVEKRTCPTDKRLVDVTIADKGTELLRRLDQKADDMDAVFDGLTSAESEQLSDLLDKLRG